MARTGPEGVPGDVPADVAALAELDAGRPATDRAARARADADPRASAVLDALAATRAELAALATPEIPPEAAARWSAALAAEAGGTRGDRPLRARGPAAPGAGAGSARRALRARERRPAWRPLLAAAGLALVVGTGLGTLVRPADPPVAVTRVELVAFGRAAVGTMDVGDLADADRRASCLRAVAPAAVGERLLGGRRVVLDDRPGVLLVLATGTVGGLRIVTVDPGCGGPEGGTLRAQLVVG